MSPGRCKLSNPAPLDQACSVRVGWAQFLTRIRWDYFLTLTFDPRRNRSKSGFVGPEAWLHAWRWFEFAWLSECAIQAGQAKRVDGWKVRGPWASAWRAGRGRPMWVLALEPHGDGRLHAHVLVKLTRELPWLDYRIGQRLWRDNRGICKFEVPADQRHVANYVAKYVTKFGPDALTLSANFEAPRMAPAVAESVAS